MSTVYARIPDCDKTLMAEAGRYGVADLHEALGLPIGRTRLLGPAMKPLNPGLKIVGQAVTAENFPGDNLFLYAALDLIQRGQVLVMTNGGGSEGAQWGEVATTFAQVRGIAGVVVDGPIRDVDALRAVQFPIWSTSISASHPEKRGPGSANRPIVVAGVQVHPGDVIVADGDGAIAIPPELLSAAVQGARMRAERERVYKERIRAGESIVDVVGLRQTLDAPPITRRETSWREDAVR